MTDLSVEFCGVRFKNPFVLASGILGITASSWLNVVSHGAGGITTKSIWLHEHKGHPNPVIIANENYMLNAVGVPDAGIEKAKEEVSKYLKAAGDSAPLMVNIIAGKADEFAKIAEAVAKLKPHFIEVNISCPNVEDEFGKPFACSWTDAARVTRLVKSKVKRIPVIIKLSPNVENIVEIARAVVDAGADGLTVMNTVGPGMAIDIETRTPVLANKVGGLSGPALKPLTVKYVHDIRMMLPKIPILGLGGIMTGRDAIEVMMAGATLVGIGTGIYYRGMDIFQTVAQEMGEWMKENRVVHIRDIIGTVHDTEHTPFI